MMVEFEKGDGVKFISHLDLMRTMQRSLRKSGLPITYSKGFSPHVNLAFSPPLSVGIIGIRELMDVPLSENIANEYFVQVLNENLPPALYVKRAKLISKNEQSFMALTKASEYLVKIDCSSILYNQINIDNYLNQKVIEFELESKKGTKTIDIREMIYKLHVSYFDGKLIINTVISAASNKSLHIKNLIASLINYFNIDEKQLSIVEISRCNLLTYNENNELVTIFDYIN